MSRVRCRPLQYCNKLEEIEAINYYKCIEKGCSYYLHKGCAELKDDLDHPLHPQHTLTFNFKIFNGKKVRFDAAFVEIPSHLEIFSTIAVSVISTSTFFVPNDISMALFSMKLNISYMIMKITICLLILFQG